MKVCLILEGCYPYVHGGVSTWVHQYITETPDIEYVLCTIYPNKEKKGMFVYDIPSNVIEIREFFMDEFDINNNFCQKYVPSLNFIKETGNIICANEVNWNVIFEEIANKKFDLDSFFKSKEYLDMVKRISENHLSQVRILKCIFYFAINFNASILFVTG